MKFKFIYSIRKAIQFLQSNTLLSITVSVGDSSCEVSNYVSVLKAVLGHKGLQLVSSVLFCDKGNTNFCVPTAEGS